MDIVEAEAGEFAAPGGSCGNVMALLAWMGWRATPVARLGEDAPGSFVREEFDKIGVDTDYLNMAAGVKTPVVIQRFVEDADGQRTHRFSLTCPECGGWLPRYRPTTLTHAVDVIETSPSPRVFYFDRVSPAALKLAGWAQDEGALIVYEPSSIGDERQFQRAIATCHVLKYSHDRLGHMPDLAKISSPRIIIETRGAEGLRVRWRSRWSQLPAFKAPRFVDAAGSGDWCSAGLIHMIGEDGAQALDHLNKVQVDRALRFGQALAAVNCGFEGARGAMIALNHAQMNKALGALTVDKQPRWDITNADLSQPPSDTCHACAEGSRSRPSKAKPKKRA